MLIQKYAIRKHLFGRLPLKDREQIRVVALIKGCPWQAPVLPWSFGLPFDVLPDQSLGSPSQRHLTKMVRRDRTSDCTQKLMPEFASCPAAKVRT
eukprot:192779-Pleurochrysis_carterae.AAC.2